MTSGWVRELDQRLFRGMTIRPLEFLEGKGFVAPTPTPIVAPAQAGAYLACRPSQTHVMRASLYLFLPGTGEP